jgi:hypothetical protein
MTLEARVEMHEQWLISMESHHAQLAADLGRSNERLTRLEQSLVNHQKVFAEHMATVAMQMGMFMTALARMTTESDERHRKLQEEHLEFEQGLKDLRELVERYIRYRGNGNTPAN